MTSPAGTPRRTHTDPPGLDGDKAMLLARLVVDAAGLVISDAEAASALLHQATALLADQVERLAGEPPAGRLAPWQVRRALRFIDDNLGRRFHVRELAAAVRLSPGYFSHAFKDSFGRSAKAYVIERRIERAKRLMVEGSDGLAQIAKACGFADQAHLSRTFHAMVGDTPSHWRRSLSKDGPSEADFEDRDQDAGKGDAALARD